MTLYGAIDIGSNSTRLLIAKLGEGRIVPVETDLCNSRLAEGLEDTGALGKDAQARTLAAVAEFWERCREVGVEGSGWGQPVPSGRQRQGISPKPEKGYRT